MTESAVRTALKEWAVLTEAMADGSIIAMVRKGGIREQRAGFSVRHDRFLLYPTFFHEKRAELAERFHGRLDAAHRRRPDAGLVRIELVCDVVGLWRVNELRLLDAIVEEHGLAPHAVASRFHYRDNPGVQVVALRVSRLAEPVEVADQPRYQGCVSWVALDEAIDTVAARSVLPDAELDRRVRGLADALGPPDQPV